jgi:ketosteroid isomerase-like protein
MHPHEQLLHRFYSCFQRRDARGMNECYHAEVEFSDPVFPALHGQRALGMWRMLCERGTDLRLEFRDVAADDLAGRAHWEADYTFTLTGRAVHNVIDAEFEFRNGRIVRHRDRFDLPRWLSMALGWKGTLLGIVPGGRGLLRRTFTRALDEWLAAEARRPGRGAS